MKPRIQTLASLILFGAVFSQGAASAETNRADRVPAMETGTNTVEKTSRSMADAERLWEKNPVAYFRAMEKNARHFGEMDKDPDGYPMLYNSFTNMLRKIPSPEENLNADDLLALQSRCLKAFAFSEQLAGGRETWLAVARHLGEIRDQVIPEDAWDRPIHPSAVMNASSETEAKKIMEEVRRNRAKASYQISLRTESRSLFANLFVGVSGLSASVGVDEEYVQTLVELARLDAEEAQKMRRLIRREKKTRSSGDS